MSDATLSPPRSSSTAPGIGNGNRPGSSGNDTELESNTSLLQSSSQDANEDKASGSGTKVPSKQKRKRTSPKDQAILEAEYKQNPKPNKATRAVIMEKVDLNEKELQIWFQNRRQINRRKSRPLLPHEFVAFGLGGMAALTSDSSSAIGLNSNGTLNEGGVYSEDDLTSFEENISTQSHVQDLVSHIQSPEASVNQWQGATSCPEICHSALSQSSSMPRTQEPSKTNTSSIPVSESVIKSFSSTPGYLANRWNPANNSTSTPNLTEIIPPITSNPTLPSSCPERLGRPDDDAPFTKVRLSMSLDGKAELVAADLSPIRRHSKRPSSSGSALPRHRMQGLQRSRSSLTFSSLPRVPSVNSPLIPRLPRGRSRDARNWEFFCDLEARDELTTQAEHESNGSAVAAISLLRSASNSTLKSSGNKRNAPSLIQDLSSHDKRLKLGRAMSSLARLQGSGIPSLKMSQSGKSKPDLMSSPSGDSDKENWIPVEDGNIRRRPLPSTRPDRPSQAQAVLGDSSNIPTQVINFGGGKNRGRKAAKVEPHIFEDQENSETSQDVENFMRGEVSPSKKGDLDCIQGLLSLSQGNWR